MWATPLKKPLAHTLRHTPCARKKLRILIVGRLIRLLAVARFARTLATMLSSGVPVLTALDIVKRVLNNTVLEKVIEDARVAIREGESIAATLKKSGQFPSMMCHMVAVGERSGQLESIGISSATFPSPNRIRKMADNRSLCGPFLGKNEGLRCEK